MIIELLSWTLLIVGGLLGIVGGIGLYRLPDFYSRLHAAGITDTLCAMLILAGLGLQAGWTLTAFKLALIFVFLFFTAPTASHALASAALHSGLKPKLAPELNSDEQEARS